MIEIKLKVPSSKEECNVSDCSVCDLDVLTCGDCERIWKIGMDRMESCTSGKETPKVTYEDIKESVRELEEQKKKIERLQKEFIEQALKDNVSPSFSGYTLDTEKGMLLLYETPVSVYPFIDNNTFVFQKDDEEIIKVGLPEIEDSPLVTTGPAKIVQFPLPHTIFLPRLSRDGNMWCALYGENSMEGIVGFGKTPSEAIKHFDEAFYEDIVDNEVEIEVRKHPAFSWEIEDIRSANDITRFFNKVL